MTFSLRPLQAVDGSVDGSLGEHTGGLLEARGRDEAVGRKRCLGDAEQEGTTNTWAATLREHTLVLFVEAEAVNLLFEQEVGVADVFNADPAKHLTNDDLDVLVRDGHTLEPVDFLNFVDEVGLEELLAEYVQNVVRVEGAVHQRIASGEPLAFLDVDVNAARNAVFLLLAVVSGDVDLALALRYFTKADDAVDLGDGGCFTRLAGLEKLDDAWQTACDVLGTGGLTRNLREDIARPNLYRRREPSR